LITLGVVAVFLLGMVPAAEAELIKVCKKYRPSGPRVCYYVESGSIDTTLVTRGLKGTLANYCDGLPGDEGCYIVIEISIFGELPPENESPDYCYTFRDSGTIAGGTILFPEDTYYEPCSIEGQAVCFNPQDHYNRNGTSFNLPGPLTNTSVVTTCTKGGTCITESTLGLFDDNGGVCNNNWSLDFTAYDFLGQVAFCPGGFEVMTVPPLPILPVEDAGDCCASDKRKTVEFGGEEVEVCDTPFQVGTPMAGQPGMLWTKCQLPDNCVDNNGQLKNACVDNETGLLKPGVEFDCEQCDLPAECYLDLGDDGYRDCFEADGSVAQFDQYNVPVKLDCPSFPPVTP
jgi:hypothetical protein